MLLFCTSPVIQVPAISCWVFSAACIVSKYLIHPIVQEMMVLGYSGLNICPPGWRVSQSGVMTLQSTCLPPFCYLKHLCHENRMDCDERHNHFHIWWFVRTPVWWKWTRWQITSCKLKLSKRASFRLHWSHSWFSGFADFGLQNGEIILIFFHLCNSFFTSPFTSIKVWMQDDLNPKKRIYFNFFHL